MSVFADLKYALRGLVARPLFVLIAVTSLALGIGVNTAIFSLFHQVVLRPLPVPAPQDLVNLSAGGPRSGQSSNNNAGPMQQIFSYPMFRDLERGQTVFAGLAAHRYYDANVAYEGQTRSGSAMFVSGQYFSTLGVAAAHGRLLEPGDDATLDGAPVAVLGHAYWKNELGGDPDIVGRNVLVNGQPLTVVGIAPEGFSGTTFGVRPLAYVPLSMRWALDPQARRDHETRTSYWLYAFARLAPGTTREAAQTGINAVFQPIRRNVEAPLHAALARGGDTSAYDNARIELLEGARGQSFAPESAGKPLAMLLATSALVLLIACLNIANLMLARGSARAGEFALRASIGASRRRLLRQTLAEAALIGAFGAIVSLPLALFTLRALVSVLPMSAASLFSLSLDPAALWFTGAVAVATVLLFGMLPALQLARVQPITALRGESAQASGGKAASRFRSGLAVAQVAFSMLALVLAGLFTQSLANLRAVDLGLQVESIATFRLAPQRNGYEAERALQFFARLEETLAALPGVQQASASLVPVLGNSSWGRGAWVQGVAELDDSHSLYNEVGPGFFDAFGIPLLAGRGFDTRDIAGAPPVAIVNRAFLQKYGLGPEAVGRRMSSNGPENFELEIVGVVADTAYNSVRDGQPALFYLPWRQNTAPGEMNFYVRSTLDPAVLLPQLREAVRELDPALPVEELRTLPEVIDAGLGAERFVGSLSAALAALATVLAALGLYGVLSYTLARRLRELGLRLALGAAPQRLRAMVLRQVAQMTALGAAIGLLAALGAGRAAQSQLFGLQGHDPFVLGVATFLLVLVAFAAGYGPARRASRIDPMAALRHE